MTDNGDSKEGAPDVPQWVLYIVLAVRVGVGLAVSVGVLYVVSLLTSLPFLPPLSTSMFSVEVVRWIAVMAVIEFAVVGVLFYPLVFLSWLVACLFYKPLRDDLREEIEERSEETA